MPPTTTTTEPTTTTTTTARPTTTTVAIPALAIGASLFVAQDGSVDVTTTREALIANYGADSTLSNWLAAHGSPETLESLDAQARDLLNADDEIGDLLGGRAVLAAIISCEAKAVGLSPSAVADGYAALRSPDLSDEDLEIEQLTNQLVSEAGIDLLPAACPDVEVGEYEPPPSDDADADAGTDSNTRDLALEIEDGELDVVGATVRFSINFDSDVQVWLDRNGVIFSSSDVEDIALAELSSRVPADEAGGAVPGTIALRLFGARRSARASPRPSTTRVSQAS